MAQIQKVPTNRAFQRLSSFPLDGSCLFNTLVEAQEYCNGPVAYSGQVVYVADARNQEEIDNSISIYDKVYFINSNKILTEFSGVNVVTENQIDNAFDEVFEA